MDDAERLLGNSTLAESYDAVPFGAMLRDLRQEAGYTAAAFAKRVGVQRTFIHDIEAGRKLPLGDTPAILDALDKGEDFNAYWVNRIEKARQASREEKSSRMPDRVGVAMRKLILSNLNDDEKAKIEMVLIIKNASLLELVANGLRLVLENIKHDAEFKAIATKQRNLLSSLLDEDDNADTIS